MHAATRPLRSLFLTFMTLGLNACGSDDSGPSHEEGIPKPSVNGMQLATAEFTLPPGADSQSCYYTTLSNEKEVFVREFNAFQGKGGHHVVLMTPVFDKPDGTVEDCTEGDQMINYLPLVTSLELNHFELEGGLGIRLPPHAKVVVQSHYVNPNRELVSVRDVVNLEFIPDGEPVIPVAFWATGYLDLAVPPQSTSSLKYRCTADQDLQVLALIGHMHEQGSHISIDIGPSGAPKRVYAVDGWQPAFRDTPPQERWTLDAPLAVRAGDVIDVTCNWNSAATVPLAFPVEMCASNAWIYPANASITCMGELLEGNAAGG
jgi:hypothetical protein